MKENGEYGENISKFEHMRNLGKHSEHLGDFIGKSEETKKYAGR